MNWNKITTFFEQRSTREKVLLAGVSWVVLLIIVSLCLDSLFGGLSVMKSQRAMLKNQAVWLNNESVILDELEIALQSVNPEKTYTATKLIEFLDKELRNAKLSYELSSPRTESMDLFKIHSVNINIRNASMMQMLELDNKIQSFFPNVVLNNVFITTSRSNPKELDIRLVVNSLELDTTKINNKI